MSERILGRGAELQQVGALLADEAPAWRALVLTGDAGVGKTTIWEEGVRLAAERGLCVLAARPAEAEAALPFAGLGDLLVEPALARFDGIAGHFSTYAVGLVGARSGGGHGSPGSHPTAAQIRALLRAQIAPHGRAARIGALLAHDYALRFRALTAGTAKVEWYRLPKGHKPVLIASGRHVFAAAGRATLLVELTAAGRSELARARRLVLVAEGTFTRASGGPPVTAVRSFAVRR
jgi:hypothetical protein